MDTQRWYVISPRDDKQTAKELAEELIEHEDGAVFRDTARNRMYLYTKITWDELIEQFEGSAAVGLDHTEGGSLNI